MFVRTLGLVVLLVGALAPAALASTRDELNSAAQGEKIAFILVTDRTATGVDETKAMIREAMQSVGRSTMVLLDRSEAQNAELVTKFGLSGAPVPLILIAARNGMLAAGLPAAQATAQKLVSLVPTPKMGDVLKALEAGKGVFLYVSRKGMTSKPGADACAAACGQLDGTCVTVRIDMDDPQEQELLKKLKVNQASTEPVTLVINAQGQLTGTYAGAADIASLVQAATKKVGGCCPSTVQNPSASCAPAKK